MTRKLLALCILLGATPLCNLAKPEKKKPAPPGTEVSIGGHHPKKILEAFGYKGVEAVGEGQRANYRRVFGFLDADRDKRHSKKEYVEDGRYMTREARQGIFRAADSNQDGFVSEEEYVVNRIITDEAKEIFFKMDLNDDSRLTTKEFMASKTFQDPKLAKAVFQVLDLNGDGALIIPEYLRVWGQWARRKNEK